MNIKRILHLSKSIIIICFIFTEQKIISSDRPLTVSCNNPTAVTMQPLRQDELNEQTIEIMQLKKRLTEQEQKTATLEDKIKDLEVKIKHQNSAFLKFLIEDGLFTQSANPSFDATKAVSAENPTDFLKNQWVSLNDMQAVIKKAKETFITEEYFKHEMMHLHENAALMARILAVIKSQLKTK